MTRPRLAILNASYDAYNTRRNFRRELDAELVEYNVTDGDIPTQFDVDGFVVTGSRASVYWDEQWIAELEPWVSKAIERGIPALGVCFGHQFLAHVLGGEVEDMGEYELGYTTVQQTADSELLAGLPSEFVIFETHSDRVRSLPDNATKTLENEYGIQGFETDTVYSVQFHPEYDIQTAREVTKGKDTLSDERISAVLDGIDEETYRDAAEAKQLFENFTDAVRAAQPLGASQPVE
ncbi:type 1 glutamine amidotransferase [Halovenus rubra]|uniref:Type 1 glutamine amidotransferase n=2 Tax=Halovenus rubra TaxID=869890 RepID=A0ACC7DZL4_9EURY|nr:type 1 glutamine amidotransferase [Halovenus rubra]